MNTTVKYQHFTAVTNIGATVSRQNTTYGHFQRAKIIEPIHQFHIATCQSIISTFNAPNTCNAPGAPIRNYMVGEHSITFLLVMMMRHSAAQSCRLGSANRVHSMCSRRPLLSMIWLMLTQSRYAASDCSTPWATLLCTSALSISSVLPPLF